MLGAVLSDAILGTANGLVGRFAADVPTHLVVATTHVFGLPEGAAIGIAAAVVVVVGAVALVLGRRSGRRSIAQRLTALGSRLGEPPSDGNNVELALGYLEQMTSSAAEAVAATSADAIRLRRSLDAMPQGLLICDENGVVAYRNARAAALMTSRHGDALAAQAVTELLESGWSAGLAERTLELYGPPRRTLSIRAHQIDDGRRPLGVIAIIDDVSERRRLDEIRRDFVANVSHELKTPMGALGLLAETLVAEPDPEVARRLANRIHTEAFRVSRIIDDLLDLSRIESAEGAPRDPVQVNLVMAEAVERVRSAAEQRQITIELTEPVPPVTTMGDRRQLVSALHALLENAVTYSYEGSTVQIIGEVVAEAVELPPPGAENGSGPPGMASATGIVTGTTPIVSQGAHVRAEAGFGVSLGPSTSETPALPGGVLPQGDDEPVASIRISVVDHGIGIPARDLERIFERFYRVDLGRSRGTGGTGLGLSIVRHVANNHLGRVDVESREGEGSIFSLVLPLRQVPAGALAP